MNDQKLTALDVAGFFVQISSSEDEPDLTNLKMQKLLCFAQAEYLALFEKPLFSDEIEAWDYGPVVKTVYHAYKHCGSFPITVFDTVNQTEISSDHQQFLKSIWDKYAQFSAEHLVRLTHKKGMPWEKYYEKGHNNIIPQQELSRYSANMAV